MDLERRIIYAPRDSGPCQGGFQGLLTPGCWDAYTSFTRTLEGTLLFAEMSCLSILLYFIASTLAHSSVSG